MCGVKSANRDAVELWVFDPNMDGYGIWRFKPGATEAAKTEFRGGSFTDEIPPGAVRPPRIPLPRLIAEVDELPTSRAARDQFSGAILLAQNGRVRFQKAYGLADRALHKSNTLETQFRFGSMGKMFTAVAIMQLIERSKIDLQAPIGRYLKDYPNQDIATKVTVANLLSHTGGQAIFLAPISSVPRRRCAPRRTMSTFLASDPPYSRLEVAKPTATMASSSLDASWKRYPGSRTTTISNGTFSNPRAWSTGNRPESKTLPRRAVGYTGSGTGLKSAEDTLPLNGTAAGGGYSTVGDFNRFMAGLLSHRLLRRETLQKLVAGGVKTSSGELARFDFGETVPDAGRWIGHAGGAPGMAGTLQHFLNSGVTLIILANRDPTNV